MNLHIQHTYSLIYAYVHTNRNSFILCYFHKVISYDRIVSSIKVFDCSIDNNNHQIEK